MNGEWCVIIKGGVLIRELRPVNAEDSRGPTFEFWKDMLPASQITACERYVGCVAGDHYHLGRDSAKNPERFVLWSGSARLLACDGVVTRAPWISASRYQKIEIQINPLILHAILPYEDISFFEHRMTLFDRNQSDTYDSSTFLKALRGDQRSKHRTVNDASLTRYFSALDSFKHREQWEKICDE